MTIRMMTVVKQLPDQDELEASQLEGPPTKEEASQRPVLWQAEDMVIDEECDTSFETFSDKESKAKDRQPLGVMGSNGSIDPDSQMAPNRQVSPNGVLMLNDAAYSLADGPRAPRTFTYSLPPDAIDDVEQDRGLTDADRLRLAAVSSFPSTFLPHAEKTRCPLGNL